MTRLRHPPGRALRLGAGELTVVPRRGIGMFANASGKLLKRTLREPYWQGFEGRVN